MTTLRSLGLGLLAAGLLLAFAAPAEARIALKSICRVKGQEENTLQGLGIVVGLRGTGDGGAFAPTTRTIANLIKLMGRPLGNDMKELKDVKNVALVTVTATIPATGARQGDRIDCVISALAAKSLAGGRLFFTPLTGGRPDQQQRNPQVFAFAEGPVTLEDPTVTTTGRVRAGCRLEEDFFNVFSREGKITLVLEPSHADFEVAQDVVETINSQLGFQGPGSALAKAINPGNVEVLIPQQYIEDPVLFISQVLALPILEPQTGARVVINERAGSIVISGDVEIGAVVVTHKNIVVETGSAAGGGAPTGAAFRPLDNPENPSPRLKALVESLNALHVPPADVIDIIKGLQRNGKLHAQVILE